MAKILCQRCQHYLAYIRPIPYQLQCAGCIEFGRRMVGADPEKWARYERERREREESLRLRSEESAQEQVVLQEQVRQNQMRFEAYSRQQALDHKQAWEQRREQIRQNQARFEARSRQHVLDLRKKETWAQRALEIRKELGLPDDLRKLICVDYAETRPAHRFDERQFLAEPGRDKPYYEREHYTPAPTPSSDFWDWLTERLSRPTEGASVSSSARLDRGRDAEILALRHLWSRYGESVEFHAARNPPEMRIEEDYEPTMTLDAARFMSESFTHRLRAVNWDYLLHEEI